jgi:hypothetical protein
MVEVSDLLRCWCWHGLLCARSSCTDVSQSPALCGGGFISPDGEVRFISLDNVAMRVLVLRTAPDWMGDMSRQSNWAFNSLTC